MLSEPISDCRYVSRVLGAVMPLRCNSRQYYSSLDVYIVTGRVSIKPKLCNFTLQK
jgi:hypothetical protein